MASRSKSPAAAPPPPPAAHQGGRRIRGRFTSVVNFLNENEKHRIMLWQPSEEPTHSFTTMVFTPIWNFCATLIPTTVAPNIVTLAGLLCQVQAFYLSYTYVGVFPKAVPLIACVLTMAYQTLSSIDAKHAQNTRNASPVTEIFDHSCTTVGSIFMILTLSCCLGADLASSGSNDDNIAILWYIVQSAQLMFLKVHMDAFSTGDVVFGFLSGPGEVMFIAEIALFAQALNPKDIPIQEIVANGWQKFVNSAIQYVPMEAARQQSIAVDLCKPLIFCKYMYLIILMVVLVKALRLGEKHYSTRNGLLLCYVLRAAPGWLLHITTSTAMQSLLHIPQDAELQQQLNYELREVVLDGLFMSVICADLIVCKMAKRDLHPFIVIFAMISTVSALSIPAIAAFYFIAIFSEISTHMNIPVFTILLNVYVDGVYDLCHIGHKKQFQNALIFGNRLLVGLVSDENVHKYKSKYPVMTLQERCAEVEALRMVSVVIPNSPCPTAEEWPQEGGVPIPEQPPTAPIVDEAFIRKYNIHVVAHGEEYLPENMKPNAMDYYAVPRRMGLCKSLPRTPGISTSELMKRIQDRVPSRNDELAMQTGK